MDRHNLQRRSSALKSDLGSFNAPVNRAVRADTRQRERRVMRDSAFLRNRNLPEVVEELESPVKPPPDTRRAKLEKWKKLKEAEKLKEKLRKKPDFKCGKIHYKDSVVYAKYEAPQGHDTKILPLCPTANYQFKAPKGLSAVKITVPKSPRVLSRSGKKQLGVKEGSTTKSPNARITRAMRQKMETKAFKSIPEVVISVQKLPITRRLDFALNSTSTPVKGPFTMPHVSSSQSKRSHAVTPVVSKQSTRSQAVTPMVSKQSTRSQAVTPMASKQSTRSHAVTPMASKQSTRSHAMTPLSKLKSIKSSTVTSESENSKNITDEVILPDNAAGISQQPPTKEIISSSQESASKFPQTFHAVTSIEGISSTLDVADAVQELTITPTKEVEHSIMYSPFLTYTRGKHRRSSTSRAPSPVDAKNELANSATYFSNIMCDETRRMQNLCDEWTTLQADQKAQIPTEVDELIDLEVGRTKLLLGSKMKQFGNLVGIFAKGTAKPKITVADLQGFWDMMYLQVESIDLQFNKLSTLHSNGWKEEEKETELVKPKPSNRLKRLGGKKGKENSKGKGNSMLRAAIDAARKNRTEHKENDPPHSSDPEIPIPAVTPKRRSLLRVREDSPVKVPPISPVVLMVSQMVKAVCSPLETTENNLSSKTSPIKGILRIRPTPPKSEVFGDLVNISELDEEEPSSTPLARRSSRRHSRSSMKRVQFHGSSSNNENATRKMSLPVTPYKIREEEEGEDEPQDELKNEPQDELKDEPQDELKDELQDELQDEPLFPLLTRRSSRRQTTRLSMKRVQFDGSTSSIENATPKKSLPVTPYKTRRSQGPSREEVIPTTPIPSDDLISFDSPQSNRRSHRRTQRL